MTRLLLGLVLVPLLIVDAEQPVRPVPGQPGTVGPGCPGAPGLEGRRRGGAGDVPANFDKVAVRFSRDEGRTWTEPRVIELAGLPQGMGFPFDPTLVPLPDGRVRLYCTSVRQGALEPQMPAIYSAVSPDGVSDSRTARGAGGNPAGAGAHHGMR